MATSQQPIQIGQVWSIRGTNKRKRYVRVLDHTVKVVKIVTASSNGKLFKNSKESHAKRTRFGKSGGYRLHKDKGKIKNV